MHLGTTAQGVSLCHWKHTSKQRHTHNACKQDAFVYMICNKCHGGGSDDDGHDDDADGDCVQG